jgi:electron transport complex protein RnfB
MSLSFIIVILITLCLSSYVLLALIARVFNQSTTPSINNVNQLLPQTQCGECGYPGCKPYAEAILKGEAINKCLPGGNDTISALSLLLNKPVIALDGVAVPKRVAFIREAECIGCTKCIQACPVDAILGAAKQMHTVITDECTGCDLCVDPCPVDCIDMLPTEFVFDKNMAAQRFEVRMARLEKENDGRRGRQQERVHLQNQMSSSDNDKAALIAAAIARTEAKKAARLVDSQTRFDTPEE